MISFGYNILIWIAIGLLKFIALFNEKTKQFVFGRKELMKNLASRFEGLNERTIWVHCASLGEFEQGRPIVEKLRSIFPKHKILLTFFSPSGYEIRKNFEGVDFVSYLPYDLRSHVR